MNWWPKSAWGRRVFAASVTLNMILLILLVQHPDRAPAANNDSRFRVPKMAGAPRAASIPPRTKPPKEKEFAAVPVELAPACLTITMTPVFDAWPPVLSDDWCRALQLSAGDVQKCNTLLAKAIQQIADAEAPGLKITNKTGARMIILEDMPPGTRETALAGFESMLRSKAAHPSLADSCIESVRQHQALFAWEEGHRKRVTIKSGFVHFDFLGEDGHPLHEGIDLPLPANPKEAMSAADVHRYAHIYEALKSVANTPGNRNKP